VEEDEGELKLRVGECDLGREKVRGSTGALLLDPLLAFISFTRRVLRVC